MNWAGKPWIPTTSSGPTSATLTTVRSSPIQNEDARSTQHAARNIRVKGSDNAEMIHPDIYREMGLNDLEYQQIEGILGREPSDTELGMFAVMWSEHCGY